MATKPDELDEILNLWANSVQDQPDMSVPILTKTQAKQAIQTHVDKKVNEVLDRVEQEVIYDYFGSDLVLISYNKKIQKKLKKLRSDLQ